MAVGVAVDEGEGVVEATAVSTPVKEATEMEAEATADRMDTDHNRCVR